VTNPRPVTVNRYSFFCLNHLRNYSIDDQSGLGADEIHLTLNADGLAANFLNLTDGERRMIKVYYPKKLEMVNHHQSGRGCVSDYF